MSFSPMVSKTGVDCKKHMNFRLISCLVVRQASWSSLYDIRADLSATSGNSKEGNPPVKLNYRANITQSTGEDWKGVSLTLSTASPLLGSTVPKVQPWRISVPKTHAYQQYHMAPMPTPSALVRAVPAGAAESIARKRSRKVSSPNIGEEILFDQGPKIQVREGAISFTFAIEGLSTIPSDNSSHKVSIAVRASFARRCHR